MEAQLQKLDRAFNTGNIFSATNDAIYQEILNNINDPEFVKILLTTKNFTKLNSLLKYCIFFGKSVLRFNIMAVPKEFSKDFITKKLWDKYPEYHDTLKPYENLLKYCDSNISIDYFKDAGKCINESFMTNYYMPLMPKDFDYPAAFEYLPNKREIFLMLYKKGDITGIPNVEKYIMENIHLNADFWKNWDFLKVDNKDKLPKKITKNMSLSEIVSIQEKYKIEIIDEDKLLEDKYLLEILRNLHLETFEEKFERIKFKMDFNKLIKSPGKYNKEVNMLPIQIINITEVSQHIQEIFVKNTDLRLMFQKIDQLIITKDTYLFWLRLFKENFDLLLA